MMRDALPGDRERIVDIFTASFDDNLSVNQLVLQDDSRLRRVRGLMSYAYGQCLDFGRVLVSEDRMACALVMFPDRKRFTFRSFFRDLGLVFRVVGLRNLCRVMRKESQIRLAHRALAGSRPVYYLWFIGVDPAVQGRGLGSSLLSELLSDSVRRGRLCLLETSTLRNLPFYERAGLVPYQQLDVGFPLFCLSLGSHS